MTKSNLLDAERDGDPIQNAMMDWWLEWKRRNPNKVPDVSTAFEAGWRFAKGEDWLRPGDILGE